MTDATRPLIVFDVNETLLDLESLHGLFLDFFAGRDRLRLWFANLVLYSQALSLAGCYVGFGDIGVAVLRMLGEADGIKITETQTTALKQRMARLPVHEDVPDALEKLHHAGFRLFTLTNNIASVQTQQLERAGIIQCFERCFSVDPARRHKPAPETYQLVERELQASKAQLLMVACHTWDTLGAVAAGWKGALITRVGNAPLPVGPQPTYVLKSIAALARMLLDDSGC